MMKSIAIALIPILCCIAVVSSSAVQTSQTIADTLLPHTYFPSLTRPYDIDPQATASTFENVVPGLETVVSNSSDWASCNGSSCPGSHRVRIRVVSETGFNDMHSETCVDAVIPWRRRDLDPESKNIEIWYKHNDGSLSWVSYRIVRSITQSEGEISFRPMFGEGFYDVYYLPYMTNGQTFGQQDRYKSLTAMIPNNITEFECCSKSHPTAKITEMTYQAKTSYDLFTGMEVTMTDLEIDQFHHRHQNKGLVLFPTSRRNVIRDFMHLPRPWLATSQPFEGVNGTAMQNEYYTTQIGMYAMPGVQISNVSIKFSSLRSSQQTQAEVIPSQNITCFNTMKINSVGEKFETTIDIDKVISGPILPLWIGIDIGESAVPGTYSGMARVEATMLNASSSSSSLSSSTANIMTQPFVQEVPFTVTIVEGVIPMRGDSDLWRLSKLRFLNYGGYHTGNLPHPYTPLTISSIEKSKGWTIHSLNKNVTIASSGLPSAISVITPPYAHRRVLHKPMTLKLVEEASGNAEGVVLNMAKSEVNITHHDGSIVEWSSTSVFHRHGTAKPLVNFKLSASSEFDGYTNFQFFLKLAEGISVANIKDMVLSYEMAPESCRYMAGFSRLGSAVSSFDWKWTQGRNDYSLWVGHMQSGMRIRLRGSGLVWDQPRGPYEFNDLPINESTTWNNDGLGGAYFEVMEDATCNITVFTGAFTLDESEREMEFNFDLSISPNKPLTQEVIDDHWSHRNYQNSPPLSPAQNVSDYGANVNIVHQGTIINPFIIYPFYPVTNEEFMKYTQQSWKLDMVTKTYYSSGSLSTFAPEMFPFFSLNNEIYAPPHPDKDYIKDNPGFYWLQEHAPNTNFDGAGWTSPLAQDIDGVEIDDCINTMASPLGRLGNFWVGALEYVVKTTGISGVYFDGVAYNRHTILRARRLLDIATHGHPNTDHGMLDLHCGNREPGFVVDFVQYADTMGLLDSLMFGEGFDYQTTSPEYMLVSTSGIQFGIFNDMLEAGGNIYRGLTMASVTRPRYDGFNTQVKYYVKDMWQFWKDFDLKGVEMLGWWADLPDWKCPIETNHPDIKATAFIKHETKTVLIAIASWANSNVSVSIDVHIPGWRNMEAPLIAPTIGNIQTYTHFGTRRNNSIPMTMGSGWLIQMSD